MNMLTKQLCQLNDELSPLPVEKQARLFHSISDLQTHVSLSRDIVNAQRQVDSAASAKESEGSVGTTKSDLPVATATAQVSGATSPSKEEEEEEEGAVEVRTWCSDPFMLPRQGGLVMVVLVMMCSLLSLAAVHSTGVLCCGSLCAVVHPTGHAVGVSDLL
jgi:hypothetical protein